MSAADILENLVQIGIQQEEEIKVLREQVKVLREALEACIDLLSNLENIGGFVGLAVINNGQTALDQTKPKDGK